MKWISDSMRDLIPVVKLNEHKRNCENWAHIDSTPTYGSHILRDLALTVRSHYRIMTINALRVEVKTLG